MYTYVLYNSNKADTDIKDKTITTSKGTAMSRSGSRSKEKTQCMLVGPSSDKRVALCKSGITREDEDKYILNSAEKIGLLIEDKDTVGIDLWFFEYSKYKSQDNIPRYTVTYHMRLQREVDDNNDQLLTYEKIEGVSTIDYSSLEDASRKAEYWDAKSVQYMFEARPCYDEGKTYGKRAALAYFDTKYANLYENYIKNPNWYTLIKLHMFVSITAFSLQDVGLLEAWKPLNDEFLNTFNLKNSDVPYVDGLPSDLGESVQDIEAFTARVRRVLEES